MAASYWVGSDLPDLAITWNDASGDPIDFSSGYTFEVKVGDPGKAAQFTKSTGITGAAVAPNLTIAWATSGELNTLTAGSWVVQVTATRTADSKHRIMHTPISVLSAIT